MEQGVRLKGQRNTGGKETGKRVKKDDKWGKGGMGGDKNSKGNGVKGSKNNDQGKSKYTNHKQS